MTRNERCETCRFWQSNGGRSAPYTFNDDGIQIWSRPCRRFPQHVARHPDDWCGEYAQIEGQEA